VNLAPIETFGKALDFLEYQQDKKVSYRKQTARQHSCQKILARAGGVVDPVKFFL